ncbi:MAG TPA: hypothetical protein VMV89_01415, partial [Candidatus Paceibacterota bacterium]|nr:hypothetical protein [Candidatus Paceibacterota bacterium]
MAAIVCTKAGSAESNHRLETVFSACFLCSKLLESSQQQETLMKKPQAVLAGVVLTFGFAFILHAQTAAGGGQTTQQLPAPTPYAVVSQDAD